MSTQTRKEIVKLLDAAAARAELAGGRPATGKQTWFLAGLIAAAGETAADWGFGASNTMACLTSSKASEMIGQLQAAASVRGAAA